MMWRRSFRRPGLAGLPAFIQLSRDCPPFHALVVKPKISVFTPQRSSVRAKISAQMAAIMIGLPRMEPELSNRSVTTVSRKLVSSSILKVSGAKGSVTTRDRRATSSTPSSRSNCQLRFCCAIRRRCRRLARRPTTPCNWVSWASR